MSFENVGDAVTQRQVCVSHDRFDLRALGRLELFQPDRFIDRSQVALLFPPGLDMHDPINRTFAHVIVQRLWEMGPNDVTRCAKELDGVSRTEAEQSNERRHRTRCPSWIPEVNVRIKKRRVGVRLHFAL